MKHLTTAASVQTQAPELGGRGANHREEITVNLGKLLISAAAGLAVVASLLFASAPEARAAFILTVDDEGD